MLFSCSMQHFTIFATLHHYSCKHWQYIKAWIACKSIPTFLVHCTPTCKSLNRLVEPKHHAESNPDSILIRNSNLVSSHLNESSYSTVSVWHRMLVCSFLVYESWKLIAWPWNCLLIYFRAEACRHRGSGSCWGFHPHSCYKKYDNKSIWEGSQHNAECWWGCGSWLCLAVCHAITNLQSARVCGQWCNTLSYCPYMEVREHWRWRVRRVFVSADFFVCVLKNVNTWWWQC